METCHGRERTTLLSAFPFALVVWTVWLRGAVAESTRDASVTLQALWRRRYELLVANGIPCSDQLVVH